VDYGDRRVSLQTIASARQRSLLSVSVAPVHASLARGAGPQDNIAIVTLNATLVGW